MNVFLGLIVALWLLLSGGMLIAFERFRRFLIGYRTEYVGDGALPEALVVLSLRGGDRSLNHVLDGLASQDYPRYRLHVVVDHRTDQSEAIVRNWRQSHSHVPVTTEFLEKPLPSCTLKCSAIHQVLKDLAPEVGAVVLVDGDSDPYRLWLRDLVAPLTRPDVGATTGNRWYYPPEGGTASWCRFIFTGCSLPLMQQYGLAWGGSLALRRDLACSSAFLEAIATTATEEHTTFEVLSDSPLRLVFTPHAIQWNPESIGFDGCTEHLFRQLFWSHLFYPCWNQILATAIALWIGVIASACAFVIGVVEHRILIAIVPPLMIAFCCVVVVVSLVRLHRSLQSHVMDRQGRKMPPMTAARLLTLWIATPVAFVVYSFALFRAQTAREVMWRGVRYILTSPHTILLRIYRPLAMLVHAKSKERDRGDNR